MKALGIPDIPVSLLNRMSAESTPENSPGLEYKPFLHLLQSDLFASTLDYTYNRHNSTYNVRVIKKALSLIVDGYLSLEDLRSARLGFTLYEGETCNGIQLDAASVIAAMRVTGKAIAPKKLQVWLDTVEEDVPGRLQLYEFLDLVKLCNDRNEQTKAVPNVTTTIDRSRAGLFDLTDANFLLTPNQKLAKHMDDDYDSSLNLINSQQLPPRETLTAAKKSASSPDFHNYLMQSKSNKRIEDSLDLYGQIRDSIRSSASGVQAVRATHNSTARPGSSRPRTSVSSKKSRLPSLGASGRRSVSVPSMRSAESYQKGSRAPDTETANHDNLRDSRDMVPRHMTSSASVMRGILADGEFSMPERRIENYEILRDYIVTNGEASMGRVVTSSIGASHKQHISPPSSPKMEERKKKSKTKRAFEEPRKAAKPSHKDHRYSMDSLANNLEDIMHGNRSHNHDLPIVNSAAKRPSIPNDDDDTRDTSIPTTTTTTRTSTPDPQIRLRPRTVGDGRNITFNLTTTGDQN